MTIKEIAKDFKVLIIDDNDDGVQIIRDSLHALDVHDIHVAHSPDRALTIMKEETFSIAIVELHMQNARGTDLINKIRQTPEIMEMNLNIPIIILSGAVCLEDVSEARDSGATEFMAKPFTIETLEKMMTYMIKHPRNFIISRTYTGPDRRRKKQPPPDGKEKRGHPPRKK